jgi:hypothetical protein
LKNHPSPQPSPIRGEGVEHFKLLIFKEIE